MNPLKIFILIMGVIAIFCLSYLTWYITAFHVRPHINANGRAPRAFNFFRFGFSVLWIFVTYALIGFGYYYASESAKRERKLRLIEKEKHHAEYAFLRAQINPHFLNNTLNFFYAKSLSLSTALADGIMTLSEIMHYSLKQEQDDQTTLIDEEIAHIQNVIKINQLRFEHKLQINFEVSGQTANVRIIPLVLITIVENVLKHGNCADEFNPAKISLTIIEGSNYLHLKTYNTKKKGPTELSSGIGIENMKKRLSHHYGKNFLLTINQTATDYSLEIKLYYTNLTKAKMEN